MLKPPQYNYHGFLISQYVYDHNMHTTTSNHQYIAHPYPLYAVRTKLEYFSETSASLYRFCTAICTTILVHTNTDLSFSCWTHVFSLSPSPSPDSFSFLVQQQTSKHVVLTPPIHVSSMDVTNMSTVCMSTGSRA